MMEEDQNYSFIDLSKMKGDKISQKRFRIVNDQNIRQQIL